MTHPVGVDDGQYSGADRRLFGHDPIRSTHYSSVVAKGLPTDARRLVVTTALPMRLRKRRFHLGIPTNSVKLLTHVQIAGSGQVHKEKPLEIDCCKPTQMFDFFGQISKTRFVD